jgi:predicted ATPase
MTHAVFLSGTGGTGKTTVLELLQKNLGSKLTVFPSIVREFYADQGIKDQKAFRALGEYQQRNFQMTLMKFYMSRLEQAYAECRTPYMMSDRSIFDHIGYAICDCATNLRPEDFDFFEDCIARFEKLSPRVYYVPWPPKWKTEDSFRDVSLGKDYLHNAVLLEQLGRNRSLWAGTLDYGTPADRVLRLMKLEFM